VREVIEKLPVREIIAKLPVRQMVEKLPVRQLLEKLPAGVLEQGPLGRLPVHKVVEKLPIEPPSLALATLLNQLLLPRLDADTRRALGGRCVEIHVKDAGVRARLQLGRRGFVPSPRHAHVALRISAPAASYWRLASGKEDADTLFFERALSMQGDTEFALLVKNTLDAIGPLVPAFLQPR
jgi:predicted lipid carrier protein YhbT